MVSPELNDTAEVGWSDDEVGGVHSSPPTPRSAPSPHSHVSLIAPRDMVVWGRLQSPCSGFRSGCPKSASAGGVRVWGSVTGDPTHSTRRLGEVLAF